MILRGLASITVVAGLAGMLWSAPVLPPLPVVPVAGSPSAAETAEPDPDRSIDQRLDEFIERVRGRVQELRAAGRVDEAERLEQEARRRLAAVRELRQQIAGLRAEIGQLRAAGHVEEAQQLQQQARERAAELRRQVRPEPRPQRETDQMRAHLEELHRRIAELHADGQPEAARELQQQAQRLAVQLHRQEPQPPRRPRPDDELIEMRTHLENMHREIAALHERGRLEEAAALQRQAEEMGANLQHQEMLRQRHDPALIEMRTHLENMHREIAELHASGRHEEAAGLERQAEEVEGQLQHQEMLRQGEDPALIEMRMHLENMHREMNALHAEGRHGQAEEVARRAQELMMQLRQREERRPRPVEGLEELERRLQHMTRAAENLEAADMPDQAEQLRRHAEEMERQLRQHMEGRPGAPDERLDILMGQMHELRAEVRELTELVRELHRRLDRFEQLD